MVLLSQRALYWPERRTLIVSDIHLGKAESFQSQGIPIPAGSAWKDLERLSGCLDYTRADRLIVLGDCLHATEGTVHVYGVLSSWRLKHPDVEVGVVLGNHDAGQRAAYDEFGIEVYGEFLNEPPFIFKHFPDSELGGYVLGGHIHPQVRIVSSREVVRVPCFYFRKEAGVLPAFGSFTGGGIVQPEPEDNIFIIADDDVIEL